MRIAILTLHDLTDYAFHEWLDLAEYEVFVLCDEETQTGDLAKIAALGYRSIRTYANYINNGNVDADVLTLHRERPLDRLLTFGEDDVIRGARLRRRLGLPGQSSESALAYRDKATMKEYMSRAGVAVPAFRRLTGPLDLVDFEREHGLPLFVKPLSSSGSTGTKALRTRADLDAFLAEGFRSRIPFCEYVSDLVVEKFVEGHLYHVDGFVLRGKPVFIVPSRYEPGNLQLERLANAPALVSYNLSESDPLHARLRDVVVSGVAALPP